MGRSFRVGLRVVIEVQCTCDIESAQRPAAQSINDPAFHSRNTASTSYLVTGLLLLRTTSGPLCDVGTCMPSAIYGSHGVLTLNAWIGFVMRIIEFGAQRHRACTFIMLAFFLQYFI